MGPPVDSGLTVAFFQWLNMVDITIVFMGVISWFINQRSHMMIPPMMG